MSRPARTRIDLGAIRHNYDLACRLAPQSKNLAVVKSNAYGHGAVRVARALESSVPAFGVACIDEALELREAGINKPFLLLEGLFSADEAERAAAEDFWVMIHNREQLQAIIAARPARPLNLWLKIDTGMHRLGIRPDELQGSYQALQDCPHVVDPVVLATHFACADELDNDFTLDQYHLFMKIKETIDAPTSLANSPGLLGWPQTRSDWNRPGYMLYGNSPFAAPHPEADQLRPAMTMQTAVIALRMVAPGDSVGYGSTWTAEQPSRIATVAIGYGDGYPRTAPNGTPVLVNGQRAPLVGRVSMDMITVNVTDLPQVKLGDPVICWGPELSANEVAEWADTNGYEILTRTTGRAPFEFVEGPGTPGAGHQKPA